jgi:lipocalin
MLIGCGNQSEKAKMINKTTVKQLDLQRYLGTWYEIARYDHRFERGLVGVTANYSIKDDGNIKVVNQGYKTTLSGRLSIAEGKAKLTNNPGSLKVSFFWIFYADYHILEIGDNYEWALIGSKADDYLWILSRTPQMEDNVKHLILKKAEARGYDTSKLIWVEQGRQ